LLFFQKKKILLLSCEKEAKRLLFLVLPRLPRQAMRHGVPASSERSILPSFLK
jgi:hypothetical protein